jgi:hypothetical protein
LVDLVSINEFVLSSLFGDWIKILNAVKPLFAERTGISAALPPLLYALETKLVRAFIQR